MQRTIYECDQCKKEIGAVAHLSIQFAGMGNTSGIANPPKSAGNPSNGWHVSGFPTHFIHLHFGCVATYFKALQPKAKK